MASLSMHAETILNYRALGRAYQRRMGRQRLNSMFKFIVGDPAAAAQAELDQMLDDAISRGSDPAAVDVPRVPLAGNGSVERFDSDEVDFIILNGSREAAPLNSRGAAARVATPTGKGKGTVTMARTFDVIEMYPHELLVGMREDERYVQDRGFREMQRQLYELASKHVTTQQVWLKHLFFGPSGNIYVNEQGKILESSSGAYWTIDNQISSGHLTNLGGIISANWSTTSTDIPLQLDGIIDLAETDNVETPRYIFMNRKNKGWLRENTKIQAKFSGIDRLDQALAGDTFELEGWTFIFSSAKYTAADGSTAPYIPLDKVAIIPEVGDWFLNGQGIEYVPSDMFRSQDAQSLLNSLVPTYGAFGYSQLAANPVKIQSFFGVNFIYFFRNADSVFVPTVA